MRLIQTIFSRISRFCFSTGSAGPKFIISRNDSGITIDFPAKKTTYASKRSTAWRLFEAGVFLLVGTLIAFAICEIGSWRSIEVWLVFPFAFGLLCLVLAAHQRWEASGHPTDGDYVRQINVSGNMLIRTHRDDSKTIWYADEIAALVFDRDDDIGDYPNVTILVLELHDGKKDELLIALEEDAEKIGLELQKALRLHVGDSSQKDTRIRHMKSSAPHPETRIIE